MKNIEKSCQIFLKNHIEKEYDTSVEIIDEDIIFDISLGSIKYQIYCMFVTEMLVIHLYTGISQEENNIEILKLINILNDRSPAGVVCSRANEEIMIKIHIFNFFASEDNIKNFDASMGMILASAEQYIPGMTSVNSGYSTSESTSEKIFQRFNQD
ncbi:hypothetical protein [Comamonas sp. C24C]